MYIWDKIKNLLLQDFNVIYNTNLSVCDYNEVIDVWLKYKNENKLFLMEEDHHIVKNVFDFHKENIDHVILYYSKELMDCLIMCRIDNRYINIQIPSEDKIRSFNKSLLQFTVNLEVIIWIINISIPQYSCGFFCNQQDDKYHFLRQFQVRI